MPGRQKISKIALDPAWPPGYDTASSSPRSRSHPLVRTLEPKSPRKRIEAAVAPSGSGPSAAIGFRSAAAGTSQRPSPGKSAVVFVSGERRSRWEGSDTLTILFTAGVLGAATEGARTRSSGTPGVATGPAPPGKYVQAGVDLYNKGKVESAAKYFKAAQDYRDMLTGDEQARLDHYRGLMEQPQPSQAYAPTPTTIPCPRRPRSPARRCRSPSWQTRRRPSRSREGGPPTTR